MDLVKDIVPNLQLTTRLIFPPTTSSISNGRVCSSSTLLIWQLFGFARTKMMGHSQIPAFGKGYPTGIARPRLAVVPPQPYYVAYNPRQAPSRHFKSATNTFNPLVASLIQYSIRIHLVLVYGLKPCDCRIIDCSEVCHKDDQALLCT
jgi:hypothetical protein